MSDLVIDILMPSSHLKITLLIAVVA